LNIKETTQDGAVIFGVDGRVTMQSAHLLLTRIKKNLKSAKRLIINLGLVEYMDSSGIGVLVTALKLAKEKDVPFGLVSVNERVSMVLDMSGLVILFQIYQDEATALAELGA